MPSFNISTAWKEARTIVWSHRRGLALGLFLTLISRLAGLILPGITKFLIDDVLVYVPGRVTSIVQYLGADYHFRSIARGVIDSRDLVYFLSGTAIFLSGAGLALRRRP